MKTHLPVALRKALIAAIFAVSAFVYNKAYGAGETSVLDVTVSGHNQSYSHDGNINVSAMTSVAGYDNLNLYAGVDAEGKPGDIAIESAATTLYNAQIKAEGDITVGVDPGSNANKYLDMAIRGSGNTVIEAGGDIVINHRVYAVVGQDASSGNETSGGQTHAGTLLIKAGGDITFDSVGVQNTNISMIRLSGNDSAAGSACIEAGGDIIMKDAASSVLTWNENSLAKAGGNIVITMPFGDGEFLGNVEAGESFSFAGANCFVYGDTTNTPTFTTGTGINVSTSRMIYVVRADMSATQGNIEFRSNGTGYSNSLCYVNARAYAGDIVLDSSAGCSYMLQANVISDQGSVSLTGAKVEALQSTYSVEYNLTLAGVSNTGVTDVTATANTITVGTDTSDTNISSGTELGNVHSSFTATEKIDISGKRVNISENTTIRSNDGAISINAAGQYAEDPVAHRPFGSVNIQESEVEAQSNIDITGAAVIFSDVSVVSKGGNVPVTGETDFVSGEDTSPKGTVKIGGSVSTSLQGAKVDGGTLSIGVAGGSTAIGSLSVDGQTKASSLVATDKIEITGSTVGLNGVSVVSEGAADDGTSVAITGTDVEIIGEKVSGGGNVSIGGNSSTIINGVDIEGLSVTVGAGGQTEIKADTSIESAGDVMVSGAQTTVTGSGINTTAGTVSFAATDSNDVVDRATVNGASVVMAGAENTITGLGTKVTGTTEVTITGTVENEISDKAQVVATNGTVKVDGGTTGANTITGADTLVQAGSAVDIDGKTNSIAAGADVLASGSVTIDAAESNEVVGGATVNGESVAMAGAENTIDGIGTSVTGATDVTITGTNSTMISGSAQVVATNGTVKVDGGTTGANTITGADTLVQAGTAVDIDGKTNSIAAGADVLANGGVTIDAAESNEVIGGATVDGNSVVMAGAENTIDGIGTSVTGATDVTITGTNSTTISGAAEVVATNGTVKVDGGTTGSNTITGADTLVKAGSAVDIDGKTNSIAAGADVLANGGVTIDAAESNEVIGGATVDGETVALTAGSSNTISGAGTSVTADTTVDVEGTSNSIADGAKVDAGTVATITATASNEVIGGATVDGNSVVMAGAENTIDGIGTSVTGATDVTITGTTSTTISGAAQVVATNGTVKVDGGTTAANTITGADILVQAGSAVDIDGKTNSIAAGADVLAGGSVTIDAAESNEVIGGATVDGETVALTAGSSNTISGTDTLVTADTTVNVEGASNSIAAGAKVEAGTDATLTATTSNEVVGGATVNGESMVVAGSENTIDGIGTSVTGATDVTITGTTSTTISGAAQVVATNGVVKVDGNTTGANTITGADTLVQAGTAVDIDGKTNSIAAGADVLANGGVTIDAAESNEVIGGATVSADTVTVTGPENTITGLGTKVTGTTEVTIIGTVENVISDKAQVVATNGTVKVDGGTTGANTITGADTLVQAGSAVDIDGKTNSIAAGAGVLAGGSVTIDADESNEVISGATVSADTVAVTGPENTITGLGTKVTGTTDVTITGTVENEISDKAQVVATNGTVKVDGGTTAANTITGADTLVQAGSAVDIDGKINSIAAGAGVLASGSVTIDADESNEVIGGATVSADTVTVTGSENTITGLGTKVMGTTEVTITGTVENEISDKAQVVATNGTVKVDGGTTGANTITGADTLVKAGTAVDIDGKTNSIAAGANVLAGGSVTIDAAERNEVVGGATVNGESVAMAGAENTIDGIGTSVTGATDVTITGTNSTMISGSAQVVSTNGTVKVDGGTTSANTITGADTLVKAGTAVDIDGKTNSIAAGANVLAGGSVTIEAAERNEVVGGATVDGNSVAMSAGTSNTISGTDTLVTADTTVNVQGSSNSIAAGAKVEAGTDATITATTSNEVISRATVCADTVAVTGPENTITGLGTKVAGTTEVTITGTVENEISDKAQVVATNGSVKVDGGTTGANTITGADTLVKAGTAVDIDGKTNSIAAGADVLASGIVTIDAAGSNEVVGDATVDGASVAMSAGTSNTISGTDTLVTADTTVNVEGVSNSVAAGAKVEAGTVATITATTSNEVVDGATVNGESVAMAGAENTIDGIGTSVTGDTDVSITGTNSTMISGSAQVVATNGTVKVDGGTTAANTITGADTLVKAGTAVDIDGKTNSIAAGADVLASGSVTIDASESNKVVDGATVNGESVAMAGAENTIDGVGTSVTGATDVTITGTNSTMISGSAQVVATNGTVKVDGGTTGANTITGADTLVQAGTAVDIDGKTNSIAAGADVLAGGSVTIDAAESNEVISGATVDGASVAMSAGTSNTISGTDTLVTADTTVNVEGASNSIAAGAKVEAGTVATITATTSNEVIDGATVNGESVVMAGSENTIDGIGTSVTGATDVTITGTNSTTISGSAQVVATNESVVINGSTTAENTITGANTMVTAGTVVDIDGKSNIISSGAAVLASGEVTLDAAESNDVTGGALVYGESVSLNAGTSNTVTGTNTHVSTEYTVEMEGASNSIASGAKVDAGTVATITASTSNEVVDGATVNGVSVVIAGADNTIDSAGTSVTGGTDVTITGTNSTTISGAAQVVATNESVVINGSTTAENTITGADTMVMAGTAADIDGKSNSISAGAALLAGGAVTLDAVEFNEVADGATVYGESVAINGAENVIDGSDTLVKGMSLITITSTVSNTVSDGAAVLVSREMPAAALNTPVADSASGTDKSGIDVSISSLGQNAITSGASVVSETGSVLVSAGKSNIVSGDGTLVEAAADVSIQGAENNISTGAQVQAGANVEIAGSNSITSESLNSSRTTIQALAGDVDVSDSNYIKYASILSDGGNIGISTGSGEKSTWIEDSELLAAGNISIAGDTTDRSDTNLAVVTGEDTLVLAESITLNSVSVLNTGKDAANICTVEDGDITICHRVDVENATLTAGGNIVVDADHVLNLREASSLEGKLSGAGDINKSGGDSLLLDYDHTAFLGTIYANGAAGGAEGSVADTDNAGSWLEITDAGVGAEATIALKNTDLVINTGNACVGTLDTTQDSEANNGSTGATLLANGSFTADDNVRPDFQLVGSVLEVQKGVAGDEVQATHLKLSDATLIKLDAAVDAEGQASSDIIKATGSIDVAASKTGNSVSPETAPVTARVFITHGGNAANAAEGTRTAIMQGSMVTNVNEDVLYDVEKASNGTYQRSLKERNVHLENKEDGVELVYSKNYRSASKTEQMKQVARSLEKISDAFHHYEGALASSDDALHRLVDAFDYTRSEKAAQRGLLSVSGNGNVLPRLMQFDASRHHLSNLRRQMGSPVCPRTWKGAENRTVNTWITYTGAYDSLNGDENMGDYSRTANGFLLGGDRSLTCHLRVGASMGYENSSSSADHSQVDGDTIFLDAYAVADARNIRHKLSLGVALSSYDMSRCVHVDAGYHTFSGTGEGSTDGLTLNFGYEISSDYQLSSRSSLTRYLSFNLSHHQLDAMTENGMGSAGVITEYDDEWQADVALGVQYNREFAAVRYQEPATFYASAELHLDLLNEQASARNRFRGSAHGWQVESMKREPVYFELGAGVLVPLTPAWTGTAGAAVELGTERSSFSGNIGVRYSF